MSQSAFKTGMNFKGAMWGVGLAALGVAAGIAAASGWRLRIRTLALPGWVFYIVAALVLGLGILLVLMALKDTLCATCNVSTTAGDAYFPLELEEDVVKLAKAADFKALMALPMVPKNQMKMAISGLYCPQCEKAARISVTRWKDYQPTEIVEDFEVTGEAAEAAAELIQQHESHRESEGASG